MKKLSRILALLLAVSMLAALLCVPAFAEEDPYAALRKGTGYVAIGDSFTRGYGACEGWDPKIYQNEGSNDNCRNVTDEAGNGAYPNLVANAFKLFAPDSIRDTSAKLWPVAHNAMTTEHILSLLGLEDCYRDDALTDLYYGDLTRRYNADLKYFGDPASFTLDGSRKGEAGEVMSIRELVKEASLISIQLGQSDVLYKAQQLGLDKIMDEVASGDTEALGAAVLDLVSMLFDYYNTWTGRYATLLSYVHESNPDAKVVLVGTMNPIANATLSEEMLAPIGSALNIIMDSINAYIRQCAELYGYIFVDISNVETPSTEEEITLSRILELTGNTSGLQTHPTPNGYAQIARMIVAAVKEELAKDAAREQGECYIPEVPNTFIQVDVGRFERIDYVKVNGHDISNFTVEDHVLTVPCFTPFASNLTVEVVKEDGSVTLITYDLEYDLVDGYTAHRAYETNNLIKTLATTIKLIAETIISFVKSIFASVEA